MWHSFALKHECEAKDVLSIVIWNLGAIYAKGLWLWAVALSPHCSILGPQSSYRYLIHLVLTKKSTRQLKVIY